MTTEALKLLLKSKGYTLKNDDPSRPTFILGRFGGTVAQITHGEKDHLNVHAFPTGGGATVVVAFPVSDLEPFEETTKSSCTLYLRIAGAPESCLISFINVT